MKVKVIPVLEDNYMYLVIEEHTREAVAVDVAVAKRLLEIVGREGVSLTAVLTTHHHWDHAHGNEELTQLQPGLVVMGADERISALTRKLVHGEELQFGAIHVRCLLTPGHTSGHMSYFLWEDECLDPPALFSGDALSVAGCSWHLEGSTQQMYQSLAETLGTLPPLTKVFCGHEHTLSNLEFAYKVEPCSDHVKAKLSWARLTWDVLFCYGSSCDLIQAAWSARKSPVVMKACGHCRKGMRMTFPLYPQPWERSSCTIPS
ncbi:hydroxyacylglutathione hydrolase-like protein isoform X2 [Cavia porcellus]|uniref:hydroxyacylglutathione hydrolase-like protein isoform X2 n=1 Tax=Cavia porcellus TaxID=10141 RepID=UPI000351058D|nr:hydroxyacylglutathione hydrolase-like protein isoform X2 [Cavia porcellus]